MTMSRRDALTQLGGLAASLAANPRSLSAMSSADAPAGDAVNADFPRKADFTMAPGFTYINGAYTHPMPKVAAEAM